jgi:hypothetical protein
MGKYLEEHHKQLTLEYLHLCAKEQRGELLTEEERKRYDYLFHLGIDGIKNKLRDFNG